MFVVRALSWPKPRPPTPAVQPPLPDKADEADAHEWLASYGFDPSTSRGRQQLGQQGRAGLTAWGWAAKEDRIDMCKYLHGVSEIEEASIDTPNESGCTPLMIACLYGNEAVGMYLIEHGADVRAKTTDGSTVFMVAYGSCSFSFCQFLAARCPEDVIHLAPEALLFASGARCCGIDFGHPFQRW
jgi:hypothetical protein